MRKLTDEEVQSLPNGTSVFLLWDGQETPKPFIIERNEWGSISAAFYIAKQNYPPEKVTLKDPLPSVLYQVYLLDSD